MWRSRCGSSRAWGRLGEHVLFSVDNEVPLGRGGGEIRGRRDTILPRCCSVVQKKSVKIRRHGLRENESWSSDLYGAQLANRSR